MKCVSMGQFNPITGKPNKNTFPCGKCTACRINHKRKWASRIMLETLSNKEASWITLTYSDKNIPINGELVKEDLKNFLKNLRRKLSPIRVRYFACGEYGDKFGRPHFHIILWNYHPHVIVDPKDPRRWYDPLIEHTWKMGGTMIDDLMSSNRLDKRCAYIAAYVLKKYREESLHDQPEFAIMSKMPAIGSPAVKYIVDSLTRKTGSILLANIGTVPNEYRFQNKMWPIPLILRKKIAYQLDIPCLPINININSKNVLTLDGQSVKYFTYGPPPNIEEDTPQKAYNRGVQARARIRRENLNRKD